MNIRSEIEDMLDNEFPEIRQMYEAKKDNLYYAGEFKFLVTAIKELIEREHKQDEEHLISKQRS